VPLRTHYVYGDTVDFLYRLPGGLRVVNCRTGT
jgi:hypothetical protein